MSENCSAETNEDPAEHLPKYCNFFKSLLVEEVALETDYRKLHYGKCAVIGRLCSVPDYFKLENVTIPHLPSEYRLPTGAVSLLLLKKTGVENLTHESYSIVRGEVMLCNVLKPNSATLTIRGLHEQVLRLSDNKEALEEFLEEVHQTYRPALSVWQISSIYQAEELIQRRLEIRNLCEDNNN